MASKSAIPAPEKKATDFGKRLRRLRLAVEPPMSSKELDRLAGLVPGHSRHLEQHDKDRVTAWAVLKLADVFAVSMDLLYAGRGRLPPANDVSAAVNPKRDRTARKKRKTSP